MLDEIFKLTTQLKNLTEESLAISLSLREIHLVNEEYHPINEMENSLYLKIIKKLRAFIDTINHIQQLKKEDITYIVEVYNDLMSHLQEWSKIRFSFIKSNKEEFKDNVINMIKSIKEAEIRLDFLSDKMDNMRLKLGLKRLSNSFEKEENKLSLMI